MDHVLVRWLLRGLNTVCWCRVRVLWAIQAFRKSLLWFFTDGPDTDNFCCSRCCKWCRRRSVFCLSMNSFAMLIVCLGILGNPLFLIKARMQVIAANTWIWDVYLTLHLIGLFPFSTCRHTTSLQELFWCASHYLESRGVPWAEERSRRCYPAYINGFIGTTYPSIFSLLSWGRIIYVSGSTPYVQLD